MHSSIIRTTLFVLLTASTTPAWAGPDDRAGEAALAPEAGPEETSLQAVARPSRSAQGGIVTGLIFDLVGVGFIGVGGALQDNLPLSTSLMSTGGGVLTVGSIIGTISHQVRHDAHEDAGYDVRSGPMIGAWTLTTLSVASYGGAVALGLQAASEDDGGLALASFGLAVGAGIFELINFGWTRSNWRAAMDTAPSRLAAADDGPGITVFPTLVTQRDDATGRRRTDVGLGVVF